MILTEPRYTRDLDVWVRPTIENAARVHRALQTFGAPMADLTQDDLAHRFDPFLWQSPCANAE